MLEKLPEECWELIIKQLIDEDDHRSSHFNLLSLVCKQFLSLTNDLLFTLKLSDPAVEALFARLLQRFRCLKHIDLAGYKGNVNSILHQIALSGLDVESLNLSGQLTFPTVGLRALGGSKTMSLKSLNCAYVRCFGDFELNLIAELFPCLEELNIRNSWGDSNSYSDSGIFSLSLKLKSLRKIKLTGNNITDNSLAFLSANFLLLCEVGIDYCCHPITLNGIAKFIWDCRHLNSISVSRIRTSLLHSAFKDSLISCKSLSVVDFSYSVLSDEFLNRVAQAHLPLKKLVLSCCSKFSFSGISTLLEECQSLEHLDLTRAKFLTDKNVAELCRFLRSIKYINLSHCKRLTGITFYALTRNCLNLNEIKMRETNIGNKNIETNCYANYGIKSLNLDGNPSIGNEFLKSLASICPNLELLKLSWCNGITEGIADVLKKCSGITHLKVDDNKVMNNVFIHLDFELPKLKVLSLKFAGIDDDGLAMIGKRCCGLLKLNLENNSSLTSKGVKEVVENCKELMEINLTYCDSVSVDIVPWMVVSRPALKKIVAPYGFVPTESQTNLFLRHGCSVSES